MAIKAARSLIHWWWEDLRLSASLLDFEAANQFTLVAEPPVLTGGIREPLGERFDHLRAALEIHPFGQELTCLAVKR